MSDGVWRSGSQTTIPELLMRRLETDPDGAYLDVCGETLTAAEAFDTGARIARSLRTMGVAEGDRVATLLENSVEGVLAWWGIILAGAIAVPINTAYKGQYLRHQLVDSGSGVVIVAEDLLDRIDAIASSIESLAHIVVLGDRSSTTTSKASSRWH